MGTKFKRKIEDFACEHCGTKVKGNGYTNHCPNCLWSKHVDVHPGDRANKCQGLMRPVGIEQHGDEMDILHKCVKCGFKKRNKRAPKDNFDAILALVQNPISN